jgi:hypothetical protein
MEQSPCVVPTEAGQPLGRVQGRRTVRAPIRPKATSPGCAAPSSAFIAGATAIFSRPTRTNARGARTNGASQTGRNGAGSSARPSGRERALAGRGTGLGARCDRAPKPHRLKAHRRACRNRLYHRRSGTQTCATSRRSDAYRWRVARSRERPGPGDDSPEAYLSPHPVFRSQRTRAVVLTPAALVPWLNGHRLAPRRQEKRGNRILSHALSRATARRTVPRQRFLR